MGIFHDFLVALEAEDITSKVETETQKALGKQSISSTSKKNNIMKTDDILGTKSTNDKDELNDENIDDSVETDSKDDSDVEDINNVTDEDESDDTSDDNIDDPDDEDTSDDNIDENGAPVNTNDDYVKKIKLRENMILLYNIISANIDLLSEYAPNYNENESSKILYKVSDNLIECKNSLYNILTEELPDGNYEDILRKYIALNRVYDLCLKMMETNFNNIELLYATKNKSAKK